MQLSEVLHGMMQENQAATQPTELRIGTVVSVAPLSISINTAMQPLQASVLYLTEGVIEKKIPLLQHKHKIPAGTLEHDHEGAVGKDLKEEYETDKSLLSGGATDTQTQDIFCYENGVQLPVQGGFIILNRGLAVGDKVLLLRVQHGEKFIVLSRIF